MSELEDSAGSEPPGSSSEADSRGSTSASSGSDDDDEKQPLEQRHGWAAKHSVPQPTPLGGKRRTRTNRFPKIPRSQRCGSCENCLNPQRKKACLVARQRMEQQLGGQQAAPIARQASTSSKAGVASTTSLTSTADDPFSRSLTGILSGSGGVVQERHVALLMQLVKRAKTKPHRTTLLVVLQLSSQEVLRQAVAAKLLLDVQLWLSEFVAEGRQALVQKTLACLDKLPVTLASLQPPCELGKIVGRLRKHESFGSPVIEPAKRLVARWKAMVEQSSKAGSRPATASSGAATAAAARPMTTTHAASLDRQPSANLTEDGDLFKGTDKQRTGIKEPVPGTKKVTIKTIAVEATRGKAADTSLPAAFPSTSAASSGDPAAANKPASEASLTNAAAQSEVDKVGTSPFVSYSNLGGGVTVLGGGTSSGLSVPLSTVGPGSGGAKDRAAAAARRVPSPEPHPRKEKSKKVRWQEDKAIMGVRWFRKDDPPAAARQDADSAELPRGAPAAPAAPELPPPGFESAAKKEHLSEAAALRRHRAEEDQERIALVDALAHMVATTAWLSPADNDAMSDAELATMPAPPARGEDSTEASRFAVWRQQEPAVVYAQLSAVPATPGEPRAAADCGLAQHPATIPRIPLSLEAAAQQQQQQQQPAPYAPPVQDVGQAIQLQQQQQQELQQQQLERPAATPPVSDIGAALAQLAASGILSGAAGGGAAGASSVHLPQHNRGAPAQDSSYAWQNHHGRQADPHQRQQHQQQQQQQQQHQQQHPPPRRSYPGQRPCRFFNTPKGCFMGDRCHFAHDAPPGGISNGAKRPADDSNGWQHQSAFKRGRT